MLILSVLLYWNGSRAVESLLREDVERDAGGMTQAITSALRDREAGLLSLARSPALREYMRVPGASTANPNAATSPSSLSSSTKNTPALEQIRTEVRTFLLSNLDRFASVAAINSARQPIFRAEPVTGNATSDPVDIRFQTEDFLSGSVAPDPRVWALGAEEPLRAAMSKESRGTTLRYTVPVFIDENGATASRGALIVDVKVDELFAEVAEGRAGSGSGLTRSALPAASRFILIVDNAGRILYHTNEALRHQSIDTAIPAFENISSAMKANESGWKYYDTETARWLVAYRPVETLGFSVAVAGNSTLAARRVQQFGWIAVVLAALFGLVTALVLLRVVRRTARSIERVTEGAVAIAAGKLDEHIEVRSSDEIRLLAESFNIMTDRVREQIARETESRQFEAFMRLTAMLTHDLKNAIASLSLLVSNMERQFHRAEFRKDAMQSVRDATDKLRALVAKLSEPVITLSSEHQLPSPHDLVPVIKHVLSTVVEPVSSQHKIETKLPDSLVAVFEADRIEKVLENLMINAIEAMGTKDGTLTIEAGMTQHEEAFVSVSDTGPGMSEEFQRTKLFRAFSTTKKRGVGLGLYTCREIVKANGGHIDVESKRGSGATFRVVLPSPRKVTGRGN